MREIKYRGKRWDNKDWAFGYFVRGSTRHCILRSLAVTDVIDVDPETVGQFTGLKDRNGVEIYEGDIIEIPSWNSMSVVNFESGMFKARDTMRDTNPSLASFMVEVRCEVIGNIYESKEE